MSTITDPAKLKVVELRAELSKRGLETKGVKAVLVQRLKEALEEELEEKIPDTSIADTSTEDLDSSQISQTTVEEEKHADKSTDDPISETISKDSPTKKLNDNPTEEPPQTEPPTVTETAEEVTPDHNDVTKDDAQSEEKETQPDTEDKILETEKESVVENIAETTEIAAEESENFSCSEKPKEEQKIEVDEGAEISEEKPSVSSSNEVDDTEEKTNIDEDIEKTESLKTETKTRKSRWTQNDEADVDQVEDANTNTELEEGKVGGEKRKRTSQSPERCTRKRASKSPIKEDEPDIDNDKVQLSWYDSDLHLQLDKDSFLSAKPYHEGAFGYAWAGVRATHGVSSGKVCFEVKLTEELKWEDFSKHYYERNRDAHRFDDRGIGANRKTLSDEKIDQRERTDSENITKNEEDNKDVEMKNEDEIGEEKNKETEIPKEENEENKDAEMDKNEKEGDETESEKNIEETQNKTEKQQNEESDKLDQNTENMGEKIGENIEENADNKQGEEIKLSKEEKAKEDSNEEAIPSHLFRVGWSILGANLQLGENIHSYAYESSGNFVTNTEFKEYANKFSVGDVISSYLNIGDENVELYYALNGVALPQAITISKSDLPEGFSLFPHVLTRNYAFEFNLGAKEEAWYPKPAEFDDYLYLDKIEEKISGPKRPENRNDCEVILMCGLPASGKTHWVNEYLQQNPDKNYTLLGDSQFLDKMTVSGEALKKKFKGRLSSLQEKVQKSLQRLTEIAALRRRNYIIDQPNVSPSTQRRKLRPFEGFKKRTIVVVVVADEEQTKRKSLQEAQQSDYKDVNVPDDVLLDMKANFGLPEKCDYVDEVIYAGANEAEAKTIVQRYNNQGKEATSPNNNNYIQRRFGYHREDRNRWQNRRNDHRSGGEGGNHGNYRDRNYHGHHSTGHSHNNNNNNRYHQGGGGPPRQNWYHQQRSGGGGGMGGGWNRGDRRDHRSGPPPQRDWRNNNNGRDRSIRDNSNYNNNRNRNNSNRQHSGGGGWTGGQQGGGGSWQQGGNHHHNQHGGGSAWNHHHGGGGWNNQGGAWNQTGGGGWLNNGSSSQAHFQQQQNQWRYGGPIGGGNIGVMGAVGGTSTVPGSHNIGSSSSGGGGSINQGGNVGGGYGGGHSTSSTGNNNNSWNNYYGQYAQNWDTSSQAAYGQYTQQDWAQYAQQYVQQGQTTSSAALNAPQQPPDGT